MAAFTSVTARLTAGTIGQLAYGADANKYARSYVLVDATDVAPGFGVGYDAANDSAKLYDGNFLGVAFDDGSLAIEQLVFDNAGNPNMPVLRKGIVWVYCTQDVTPADPVYVQKTAGAGKPKGSFRKDNDGGNADLVANVQWAGAFTVAGTNKAALEVNLPA
jgi:hypothetical protein